MLETMVGTKAAHIATLRQDIAVQRIAYVPALPFLTFHPDRATFRLAAGARVLRFEGTAPDLSELQLAAGAGIVYRGEDCVDHPARRSARGFTRSSMASWPARSSSSNRRSRRTAALLTLRAE